MSKRNRRVQKRMKQARREKKALAALGAFPDSAIPPKTVLRIMVDTYEHQRLPKPTPLDPRVKELLR